MRTLLGTSVVLALIAALDAFRGDHWDQFAMLGLLVALLVGAIAVDTRRRASVRLRPDLLSWVRDHAARTDDEPPRVVDRALAAYRAEMLPDPSIDTGIDTDTLTDGT